MSESCGDAGACEIYCDRDLYCDAVHESPQIATSHESCVSWSGNDEKRRKMNEIVHDNDDVA